MVIQKILSSLIFLVSICFASSSSAIKYGDVPFSLQGSGDSTETKAYAGLKWTLEGGATPALVLGVMRAKVDYNGDTQGGNLSLDVNLAGSIAPGKLKLNFMKGKEDLQGEIGVGYDFSNGQPLLGLGLNGPHVNVGVDISKGGSIVPFAMLHTQGKFDKPTNCAVQVREPRLGKLLFWGDATCSGPGIPYKGDIVGPELEIVLG